MPFAKLRAFISSSLHEFSRERFIVELILRDNPYLETVRLETSASPVPPRERSLEAARDCDIYIGLFGKENSELAIEEYREAKKYGKPCFIYLSSDGSRDSRLEQFLTNELEHQVTRYKFSDYEDLAGTVSTSINEFIGEVLTLGLDQWVTSRRSGAAGVETKIEQSISSAADRVEPQMSQPKVQFMDLSSNFTVNRFHKIIKSIRAEVRKVDLGDRAPTWVLITKELIDGPKPRKHLVLPEFLSSTSVWLRLGEQMGLGNIIRKSTKPITYSLTDTGVIKLAEWIVKHHKRTSKLRTLLAQVESVKNGQQRFET